MAMSAPPERDPDPTPVSNVMSNEGLASWPTALPKIVTASNTGGDRPQLTPPPVIVESQLGTAIRQLLSRYEISTGQPLPAVIAVASAVSGEGVTTISNGLAQVLASDLDAKVCWLDLSWSQVDAKESDVAVVGVSEILRGSHRLEHALRPDPDQPNLFVISSGTIRGDQHRLVRSPQLEALIDQLVDKFDFVVMDTAPVLDGAEGLLAIRFAGAYLLVVRQGATSARQVQIVAEELQSVQSLGAVLNHYRTRTPAFIRQRFGT
jgi:Mrp family chromosome partitioning ATPase